MDTIVLDLRAGVTSGALLGALVEAGASLEAIHDAVAGLGPGAVRLAARGGTGDGTFVRVLAPAGAPAGETWGDVRPAVGALTASPTVVRATLETLDTLMDARARVHGVAPHEVELDHLGGPEELAGAVALVAGWISLGRPGVRVSPVGHGTGVLGTLEGDVVLPGPVVARLLSGLATCPLDSTADLVEPVAAAWVRNHATGHVAADWLDLVDAADRGPTGRGRVAAGRVVRATLVPAAIAA